MSSFMVARSLASSSITESSHWTSTRGTSASRTWAPVEMPRSAAQAPRARRTRASPSTFSWRRMLRASGALSATTSVAVLSPWCMSKEK